MIAGPGSSVLYSSSFSKDPKQMDPKITFFDTTPENERLEPENNLLGKGETSTQTTNFIQFLGSNCWFSEVYFLCLPSQE